MKEEQRTMELAKFMISTMEKIDSFDRENSYQLAVVNNDDSEKADKILIFSSQPHIATRLRNLIIEMEESGEWS